MVFQKETIAFQMKPQAAHLQIGPNTFLAINAILWPEIDSDIEMPIRKNEDVCTNSLYFTKITFLLPNYLPSH